MADSRCGLHCTGCEYKEKMNCGGCIETMGRPFHGECPVAKCCQERALVHCGQCGEFPCELLIRYSCDPVHGDNPPGARIEVCKEWKAKENQPKFIFGGVNIYTRQPERMLDFYSRLGLRTAASPNEPYFGAELALMNGEDAPVIWIWRLAEGDEAYCRNHLVFKTDGRLNEVYEGVQRAGIECSPPARAEWGGLEMLLTDPDGNTILFL